MPGAWPFSLPQAEPVLFLPYEVGFGTELTWRHSPGLQAGADTAERHVTATGLDGKSSRLELVSQKSWES